MKAWQNIGEILEATCWRKAHSGHGPISTVDDLKLYHRMLVETTDVVREKMSAGKTLAQIKTEGFRRSGNRGEAGLSRPTCGLTLSTPAFQSRIHFLINSDSIPKNIPWRNRFIDTGASAR